MSLCCLEPLRQAMQGMLYRSRLAKQYQNVLHLPLDMTLTDDTKVTVRVMTEDQFSTTYHMIDEASKLGHGFGVNEFGTLEDFRLEFKDAHKFAVVMTTTGEHVASLLLTESRYSRGVNVADPYIIVKATRRGQGLGCLCLDLCEQFSKLLGFLGLYIDTFSNNLALIRQLERRDGYTVVGTLPAGGVMPDGTVMPSLVYYKDLRDLNKSDTDGGMSEEEIVRDIRGRRLSSRRKRRKKDGGVAGGVS